MITLMKNKSHAKVTHWRIMFSNSINKTPSAGERLRRDTHRRQASRLLYLPQVDKNTPKLQTKSATQ